MKKNAALARWRAGEATIGGWLSLANVHTAETMAHLGFDWLVVDLQHGLIDWGDLRAMLPALSTTGVTPLVRVLSNDAFMIMKVLDAGALGVIVPMVNSRAEAEAAIAACRYPPTGMRSFGPIRAALAHGPDYVAEANREVACIAMIETREGLANLDEIVSTPGLDGVYVGPNDLAYALDLPPRGDTDDPKHLAAVERIVAACKKAGVAAGCHTNGAEWTRRRLEAGFTFVTLGTDAGFLMQGATAALKAARATPAE